MSLGIIVVEVCERNALALQELEQLEEQYIEVAVMRTDCLNMCNLCRVRPYAMVNQTRVFADTPELCIAKVEEVVKAEINSFYES